MAVGRRTNGDERSVIPDLIRDPWCRAQCALEFDPLLLMQSGLPGGGRGPVGKVAATKRNLLLWTFRNWAPAFAGEADQNAWIDLKPQYLFRDDVALDFVGTGVDRAGALVHVA